MYPESNYTQPNMNKPARIKKWLLIGIPVLLVILILLTILFWQTKPHFNKDYGVSKTGLSATQDFGYLNGSDVYAYNGIAFYKTNLDDGKTTVLNSGLKLPIPSDVHWANSRGALMSFSSSYSLSKVEEALNAKGQQLTYDAQSYTWYLDFASGSLRQISTQPIVPNQAYYSEADNGFYYVTDRSEEPHATVPLHFYNIGTSQNETISSDLRVTDISTMHACPSTDKLCFIARDQNDTTSEKLYSIKRAEEKKIMLDSGGRLFPTNNPKFYVSVGLGDDAETEPVTPHRGELEHVDQVDLSEEPAILHDIQANSKRELGFKVGMTEPVIHFVNNEQFYVLDSAQDVSSNNESESFYRSGNLSSEGAESTTYPITYSDKTAFDSQLTSAVSHGSGSQILVSTVYGDQVVFSDKQNLPDLTPKDFGSVDKTVQDCLASGALESQYFEEGKLFRIDFTADDNFARNITAFSKCAIKSDASPLRGYHFQFAGRDPFNGRLSTD